jgi:hypothetical protein
MKLLFILIFVLTLTLSAQAQVDEPRNICLTQTEANKCSQAVDEVKALRAELETLKSANAAKDKVILDLSAELKMKTQEIIDLKSFLAEYRAMIQFLLTNGRKKIKVGLINL